MRLFLILCSLSLINILVIAQGEEQYPDNEFTIQIQNAVEKTIVFEMIPIGANWAKTNGCNIQLVNDNNAYVSSLYGDTPGYVDCALNGFEYRFYNEGTYTVILNCASSTAGLKPLRNGFYRINVKENSVLKAFAYFDWRDLGFPTSCNTCPEGNDFTIRYDWDENTIMFWNDGNIVVANQEPDLTLNNGQIVTWADWQCNERVFTPFWDNGLVFIASTQGNPKIIWGPYDDANYTTSGYYVYRAVNYSTTPPPLNQFSLVATTGSTTYNWTDYDYSVGGPLKAHYYVKAILVPTEGGSSTTSSPTNTVTSSVGLYKENLGKTEIIESYSLVQNYPNPFNPATKISYSIKEEGLVTLKVYDVLGKEVASLVNENKPAGNYEVEFNALQLPSGVYIYTLQVNGFTSSKKMLLMK